ncbi:hypothetical protein [Rhodococcus sp. LB1]|uniref:hypothetical protein n=1 Tax=Rhodococcus sp. LB1 TaxID=1807499 RepID=UPI000B198386|nr:hypothetical protein [Rhodococcus sp. LB1]
MTRQATLSRGALTCIASAAPGDCEQPKSVPILVTVARDSLQLALELIYENPCEPVPLAVDVDGSSVVALISVDTIQILSEGWPTLVLEGCVYATASPGGYVPRNRLMQERVTIVLDGIDETEATGVMQPCMNGASLTDRQL